MTEGFDLTEYLLRELGPMGSMLGLGFYWLRNQLDRLTNAITAIDSPPRSGSADSGEPGCARVLPRFRPAGSISETSAPRLRSAWPRARLFEALGGPVDR